MSTRSESWVLSYARDAQYCCCCIRDTAYPVVGTSGVEFPRDPWLHVVSGGSELLAGRALSARVPPVEAKERRGATHKKKTIKRCHPQLPKKLLKIKNKIERNRSEARRPPLVPAREMQTRAVSAQHVQGLNTMKRKAGRLG